MLMLRKLCILAAALVLSLAADLVLADWEPEDGFKMHFAQLPDVTGWDVSASEPLVLADDWLCTETGWVKDIHFWGSWRHGVPGAVTAFHIGIYSDVPADPPEVPYSRPGTLLWETVVSDFLEVPPIYPPGLQGWYNPSTGFVVYEDHMDYWQYNVFLDPPEWFWQEESTIYWLSISAMVEDPAATQWGWKSTADHWNDDGVWAILGEFNWIDMWEPYPPGSRQQSLDLAFVINGGADCEPTPDSSTCNPNNCPAPEVCQVKCIRVDPQTEQMLVDSCACLVPSDCHAQFPTGIWSSCVVPDNGSGTADLPPVGCQYQSPGDKWVITAGLPAGTTIEMVGILEDFINVTSGSGGGLGGEYERFEATLDLTVTGTGDLAGFNRHLAVPLQCETHSAPRMPGNPIQTFVVDFDSLYGVLYGDPDFCEFIIRGGTSFGKPSPGQTSLIELPSGDFAVVSFFDVSYEIQYDGCPSSPLQDYSGISLDTIRIRTGPLPADCIGDCPPGEWCEPVMTVNADGTLRYCCECVEQVCEPTFDSSGCKAGTCESPSDECEPRCMRLDLESGQLTVDSCECTIPVDCHAEYPTGNWSSCVVPDNGTGTADLPPVGCQYQSPDEKWLIVNGLPPGDSLLMDGTLMNFTNISTGSGGSLGGEWEFFEATLDLTVTGTGGLAGFNRHLAVPMICETHSAPRTPGDPVQTFDVVFDSLFGILYGDPDFCDFIITGGTDFGLPSPGVTRLIELPDGDFAVESFFDISYRVYFEGCPSSELQDYSGTTEASIRIRTGAQHADCLGDCPLGWACEEVETINPDGTIRTCCECVPQECEPTDDGQACKEGTCPSRGQDCDPICVNIDPESGETTVIECACIDTGACHAEIPSGVFSPCIISDPVNLPPIGCQYQSPDEKWLIVDGLPPGDTIVIDGILESFTNMVTGTGGSLGGQYHQFDASFDMTITGTGALSGFNRHIVMSVDCETHSAPRIPYNPVQHFETDFYSMSGNHYGDPDFCTLNIRAGTGFGTPSPGFTTLRRLPDGRYAADSFFDLYYEIEWEGCPDSPISDYSGTATGTIRIRTGVLPPVCVGDCLPGDTCEAIVTVNPDGTLDYCCDCVLDNCVPTYYDSAACRQYDCAAEDEECQPVCVRVDLESGETTTLECVCGDTLLCAVSRTPLFSHSACTVPDNGTGTADLPPVGCEYQSPGDRWMIINGLPPGTTIEMEGSLEDFVNIVTGSGGGLGGEYEQFEATLDLTVTGTGELAGFNRHLAVSVFCETHSAPRTPGDPVQIFAVEFDSLDGILYGDPDFCEFIVRGGSAFGMSSPGQTRLIQLPSGEFAVESFFDLDYEIEFEGCPGSQISDYSGTTRDTIRIRTGLQPPVCDGDCPPEDSCATVVTYNPDGTADYCCDCVQGECDAIIGDADGSDGPTPVDIDDAVYLINFIFSGGPAPTPYALASGDADCSCEVDIDDVVFVIAYIFSGGPPPCSCEEWVVYCGQLR